MAEELASVEPDGTNEGGVDCGGWYQTCDAESHKSDDSDLVQGRERQASEERRRFEELYLQLDDPKAKSEVLEWDDIIAPYGLEATDFRTYEEKFRSGLQDLANNEIANGNFVKLSGAAEKEVKAVEFQYCGKQVRYEIFEKMDAKSKTPYEKSLIHTEVEEALDKATHAPPSDGLYEYEMLMTHLILLEKEEHSQVQYEQGKGKKLKQLSKLDWWKNVHFEAGRYLWDRIDEWPTIELQRQGKLDDADFQILLGKLKEEWIKNKNADHTDRRYQKQRDLKASEDNGILRRILPEATYWAVDPNGETLCFHHPTALVDAYGYETVEKIYDDIRFFMSLHPPNLPDPQRHFNHERILKAHPEFSKENGGSSGVAHYGCWHEKGKEFADALLLLKTSDSRPSAATTEVFLNQLLRNACAHITRVVALLFGIASPGMRDEYRRVVENIADYRRMDTTEEELWTLRAILNNLMTESHQDTSDWVNGLVWNAPLGKNLKGGDMCLRQLGIQLASPSGAVTGILGRETIHNITEWTEFDSNKEKRSRISVVHTTHESVRQEALQKLEKKSKRARSGSLGLSEEQEAKKRRR